MMNNINKLFKKPSTLSQKFVWVSTKHWTLNRVAFKNWTPSAARMHEAHYTRKNSFKSEAKHEVDSDHEWKQKSERIFKFILWRRLSKWKEKVVKWMRNINEEKY